MRSCAGDFRLTHQQPLTISGKQCFEMYYHMYGDTMGDLSVYIVTVPGQLPAKSWSKSGNFGDLWNRVNIPLDVPQTFWVSFSLRLKKQRKRVCTCCKLKDVDNQQQIQQKGELHELYKQFAMLCLVVVIFYVLIITRDS